MNYPLVSVVVVGYRRPDLLARTVESFLDICDYPNLELLLTDDGSPKAMRKEMAKLPFDRFLFTEHNMGLGANTNKGLRAARGEFILQLQDDWECKGPSEFLKIGVEALCQIPTLGLIRFRVPYDFPCYVPHKLTDSKKIIKLLDWGQKGLIPERLIYSDTPHLKPRNFHKDLGYYTEGIRMEATELEFCDRFLIQKHFKAGYIEEYKDVFVHIGDERSHRPSARRAKLVRRLDRTVLGRALLTAYRYFHNH